MHQNTGRNCYYPGYVKTINPVASSNEKNGYIIGFLKGEGEAIVDPSQFEVMKANFGITKEMSEEELKALEAYIYSNSK